MTSALLDRLSKLFTTVLAALEGERGRLGRRRRGARSAARAASRASSTWWSRATRCRSRGGRPRGWAATSLVHDRFGTATVRGGGDRVRPRRRAARDVRAAGRAARRRAGRARSRRTSPGATSRSTRSRCGWRTGRVTGVPGRGGGPRRRRAARAARRLVPRRPDAPAADGALRGAAGVRAGAADGGAGGGGGRRRRARDGDRRAPRRRAAPARARAAAGGARRRSSASASARRCCRGSTVDAGAGRARARAASPDDARAGRPWPLGAARARGGAGRSSAARLRELAFPAAEAAAIVACAGLDALVAELAGAAVGGRRVLRRRPLEAAVLAAAAGSEPARDWLDRGRHERAGDRRATTCSPPASAARRVGRALQAARAALLDGSAPDRETQLTARCRPRVDPAGKAGQTPRFGRGTSGEPRTV